MGIDRPSRSSEDDDQSRRPERGHAGQKPPERGENKPAWPEHPQSQVEQRREADRRAAEAYRERHNSMTGAERRQAIRDKQAQYLEQEKAKQARSPEARQADAKAYLEQRREPVEAYERGDLPKDQLSRSELRHARKREHGRLVAAEKAKEAREATQQPERGHGEARPDTTPTGPTGPEQARARSDRPDGTAKQAEQDQGRGRPDTAPTGQADQPRSAGHGPDRPLTRREAELADAMTIGLGTQPDIDPERLAKARADLAAERAERAARGDTSPEPRPTEAPRDDDGMYRLLAQIHDPHPSVADTRADPADRADRAEPHRRDTATEATVHLGSEQPAGGDSNAVSGGPADSGDTMRPDQPPGTSPETVTRPEVDQARAELRAALDSGDSRQQAEAARRFLAAHERPAGEDEHGMPIDDHGEPAVASTEYRDWYTAHGPETDAPAPFRHEHAERVPDYTKQLGTVGILTDRDGNQLWETPQTSGYDGPAKDVEIGLPRGTGFLASHVEMHAAATLRSSDVEEATLYLNRLPCPLDQPPDHPSRRSPATCANLLPTTLPADVKLTIYGPDQFGSVFRGEPEREQ